MPPLPRDMQGAGWEAAQRLSARVTELSASEAALRAEVTALREAAEREEARQRERDRTGAGPGGAGRVDDGLGELHAKLLSCLEDRRKAEREVRV